MVDLPIFLTGFMGVGKSKIGQLVAGRLGRELLDTDQMVEARAGKEIAQIFADEGEAHFRQLEYECVARAAAHRDAVVSLGGGAIAQERNRELIRRAGVLVCIEADVETILNRVSRREDRPLLAGLDREGKRRKVEALLAERTPYYESADIRVWSSDEYSPETTAERLLRALESWSGEGKSSA